MFFAVNRVRGCGTTSAVGKVCAASHSYAAFDIGLSGYGAGRLGGLLGKDGRTIAARSGYADDGGEEKPGGQ